MHGEWYRVRHGKGLTFIQRIRESIGRQDYRERSAKVPVLRPLRDEDCGERTPSRRKSRVTPKEHPTPLGAG